MWLYRNHNQRRASRTGATEYLQRPCRRGSGSSRLRGDGLNPDAAAVSVRACALLPWLNSSVPPLAIQVPRRQGRRSGTPENSRSDKKQNRHLRTARAFRPEGPPLQSAQRQARQKQQKATRPAGPCVLVPAQEEI